jgi:hypothetical protein
LLLILAETFRNKGDFMKLQSKYLASALAMVLLVGIGCRHNKQAAGQPPPSAAVVTIATLLDADHTCLTVQDSLTAADHAIDQLKTSDPEYYAKVGPLIKKISAANNAAEQKIKLAKDTGATDWKPALLAVASSVNVSDLSAAGVKNQTSQLIVSASLASLVGILNSITTNFGSAK